jgi:hypothetical protein
MGSFVKAIFETSPINRLQRYKPFSRFKGQIGNTTILEKTGKLMVAGPS